MAFHEILQYAEWERAYKGVCYIIKTTRRDVTSYCFHERSYTVCTA